MQNSVLQLTALVIAFSCITAANARSADSITFAEGMSCSAYDQSAIRKPSEPGATDLKYNPKTRNRSETLAGFKITVGPAFVRSTNDQNAEYGIFVEVTTPDGVTAISRLILTPGNVIESNFSDDKKEISVSCSRSTKL